MEEGRLGLDSIEKALLCKPRSTSVLLQKARVLEALGNLPEAISCFRYMPRELPPSLLSRLLRPQLRADLSDISLPVCGWLFFVRYEARSMFDHTADGFWS